MAYKRDLTKLDTKELLSILHSYRAQVGKEQKMLDRFEEQLNEYKETIKQLKDTVDEVKEILATREHVPNKEEAKEIRKNKAYAKRKPKGINFK